MGKHNDPKGREGSSKHYESKHREPGLRKAQKQGSDTSAALKGWAGNILFGKKGNQ